MSNIARTRAIIDAFKYIDPGVNLSKIEVFLSVCARPGITMQAITAETGLEQSTVSRYVGEYTNVGLLTREEDPVNRRQKIVGLTRRGADLVKKIDAVP